MNYSDYRFTLDIQIHQAQVSIPVTFGDSARRLCIGLTDGRKPYTIGEGCIAVFNGKKPDGTSLKNSCIIERNAIIYEFTEQTTNCEGVVKCDLTLYGADGKILTSPQFIIVVDKRVVRDEDVPVSQSEATAISDMITAEAYRNQNEAERIAEETVRDKAEAARQANEAQRIEDYVKAEQAEAERCTAETARADAEDSRAIAEDARQTKERQRTDQENVRENSENARVTAESARVDAEGARAEAEANRATEERSRCEAEFARETAEAVRETNETNRSNEEDYRNRRETERAEAEIERAEAEAKRVEAESKRKDGISATHSWNGTVLTITSASGTSSADLKGDKGDKGDKGAPGSVKFEELTEEQKNELRGTSVDEEARADIENIYEILGESLGSTSYMEDITGSVDKISGQYYHKDTGILTTYTGAECTDLIPVKEGELYRIHGSYGFFCPLILEFDEDQARLQAVGVSSANTDTPVEGYEYMVPSGVSFIGVSTRRTYDYGKGNYRNIKVEKHVDAYNTVQEIVDILEAKHNEDMSAIETDMAQMEDRLTLKVSNICPDANFENPSTWELGNTATSMSFENNVATLTNNGSSGVQTRIRLPLGSVLKEHVYYIQASIKSSPNAVWEDFKFYTDKVIDCMQEKPRLKNSTGMFNDYYGIVDFTQTSPSNAKLWITSTYATAALAKNQVTQIKQMFICDLTESFGAGKEPTASEFYNILNSCGNWFEGSREISIIDLIRPTLPITTNYVITVGQNGDCQTINEAIARASTVYPIYKKRGIQIEVRILDGTVIDEQILVESLDLSYISITTDNAENKVIVSPTANNWDKNTVSHDSRGNMPFFAGEFGARLPMIKCLFSCTSPMLQIEDKTIGIVGYYCNRGSMGVVVAGAAYPENTTESGAGTITSIVGFEGFYDCIIANNNSEIVIREAIARNAGRYGVMSRHISRVSARSADLTGCALTAAYADRSSMLDVRFADVSNSYNGIQAFNTSNITAVETIADNIANVVVDSSTGSTVNCSQMTVSNVKDGFVVAHGGVIIAPCKACSGVTGTLFSQSRNTLKPEGIIYEQDDGTY